MIFEFFLILTILTGFVVLVVIFRAYKKTQDTFHPSIFLGMMLFYLYSYLPIKLWASDSDSLLGYFSIQQLEYIQFLNLLGVISLFIGIRFGTKKLKFDPYLQREWTFPPAVSKRLKQAAIVCGLLGVAVFYYLIFARGGFIAAYGRAYGGAGSEFGYLREAFHLTLPALLWIMLSYINRKLSRQDWLLMILISSPMLIRGLLGARRGPTAMIFIVLIVGWYLVRARRPSLRKVVVGSLILASFLLFLVANRNNIYIGSDFRFESSSSYATEVGPSNEYIYGGGMILDANIRDEYLWGGRYLTILFVRPIPKAIWPSKYKDAAQFFGTYNLEETVIYGERFFETLTWQGPPGAYGGIVADVWIEFQWYSFFFLFLIGWFYGFVWRKTVSQGQFWIPVYTLMTALSIYLVMQAVGEMIFRLLLTVFASWLIWKHGVKGIKKQLTAHKMLDAENQKFSQY